MRDALMRLLEPSVEALGFELVDIELGRAAGGEVLRVFIDRPAGPDGTGVTVDDCALVSHAVSERLEVEDPIKGHYTLEVSSPGFDRVLRTPEHFARFVGARVFLELRAPREGRRRYTGTLLRADPSGVELEVDGTRVAVPYEEMAKARLAG